MSKRISVQNAKRDTNYSEEVPIFLQGRMEHFSESETELKKLSYCKNEHSFQQPLCPLNQGK